MMASKQKIGTVLFIIGLVAFTIGGFNVYSTHKGFNTYHYTMTTTSESKAADYGQGLTFQYGNLPETSQSIIERTLEQDGTYTTSRNSSEFKYATDAWGGQNIVVYEGQYYLLVAEPELSGGLAGIGLMFYIPLTILGGVLSVGGFFLSPLPQRLREYLTLDTSTQ